MRSSLSFRASEARATRHVDIMYVSDCYPRQDLLVCNYELCPAYSLSVPHSSEHEAIGSLSRRSREIFRGLALIVTGPPTSYRLHVRPYPHNHQHGFTEMSLPARKGDRLQSKTSGIQKKALPDNSDSIRKR